jgi:hypothetical protein
MYGTKSMEQGSYYEADSHLAGPDLPRLLNNPKIS